MKKVAIIGRPNVGKSTLFNRLLGKRKAIVHDTPGVTRDRKMHEADLNGVKYQLIDTAGMEKSRKESMEGLMLEQTMAALQEADIIIFMVDGTQGITPDDKIFAKQARKFDKDIILAVNKCERKDSDISESYKLGFGEPIAVSAEHGLGIDDMFQLLAQKLGEPEPFAEEIDEDDKTIRLALVGRPNVGKSTIINVLTKEQRVITSPIAGTTRDAIEINWQYKDENICLIDTAGMRRRSNIHEKLENFSVGDSLNAIKYAQIVVLVLDATQALEKQDLRIARHVINEGRALVLAINKWDLGEDKAEFQKEIKYLLAKQLNDLAGIDVVYCSALNNKNVFKILDKAMEIYETWNVRISTGKLNRWLEKVLNTNPPPIVKGKRLKLKYISQVNSRPPTFMISTSRPEELPDSYVKYLKNSLRDDFDMDGIPIRIMLRSGDNPYKDK